MLHCKKLFSILFLFSLKISWCFGESIPSMPEVTGIDMPSMPEMTSPTLGNSFYRPEIPGMNIKKSQEENKNQNSTNSSDSSLSSATSTEDILNSFLYNSNALTAKDISSLSEVGLFDSISSLNNTNYNYLSQNSTTDVLLNKILSNLDELKKEQAKFSAAEKEDQENIKRDLQTFKKRNPMVLRFLINGFDISPSLTTVFFSEAENDGSFLFTGDRKYYANKKNHNETFYLLFKSKKALNTGVTYSVTPTVVQNIKNENSFIYQMAQKGDITATKTGNLVVVHYSQNNWNMDLLLDIDCKDD